MIKWDLFQGHKQRLQIGRCDVHVSKMKDKNHMVTSINAEKSIWQNSESIFDTNSQQGGCRGNTIKVIRDKPTANIILNGEKQEAFRLRSGTGQRRLLLPLLLKTVLEVLAWAIWQEKETKAI